MLFLAKSAFSYHQIYSKNEEMHYPIKLYKLSIEEGKELASKAMDIHGGQGVLDFMALTIFTISNTILDSPEFAQMQTKEFVTAPPSFTNPVLPLIDSMIDPLLRRLDELNAIDNSPMRKLFWFDRRWKDAPTGAGLPGMPTAHR